MIAKWTANDSDLSFQVPRVLTITFLDIRLDIHVLYTAFQILVFLLEDCQTIHCIKVWFAHLIYVTCHCCHVIVPISIIKHYITRHCCLKISLKNSLVTITKFKLDHISISRLASTYQMYIMPAFHYWLSLISRKESLFYLLMRNQVYKSSLLLYKVRLNIYDWSNH